jgi:hypothetical protein
MRMVVVLLLPSVFLWSSCGGMSCSLVGVNVSPQSAALDHADSNNNSQQFFAFSSVSGNCATLAASAQATMQSSRRDVVWSVSDPVNVSISNTNDETFGKATCLNTTSGSVTVTATLPASAGEGKTLIGRATLSCN